MQIFVVHTDPVIAAKMLCDQHVVKQVLESAQLLCSVFPVNAAPYKRTHYNHPCAKWSRQSYAHYKWLMQHAKTLCAEYTFRYGKVHKSKAVIEWCARHINSVTFPSNAWAGFVQAIPETYKSADAVKAYRKYYIHEKLKFARWKKARNPPEWVQTIKAKL